MNHLPTWRHVCVITLLDIFPQILLVALCNSRAMGEVDENSDIDLFIITKGDNLWTVRLIVTFLTTILGVRRKNTHGLQKGTPAYIARTKEKFCLSFFITEEHLNFDDVRLQPDDPYLDRWILTLVPIINKNHVYERFMRANGVEPAHIGENTFWQSFLQKLGIIFGFLSIFENLIKKLWIPKTLRTYEKLGKPWGVVISDTMLKFHDNDRRKRVLVYFQEESKKLGLVFKK